MAQKIKDTIVDISKVDEFTKIKDTKVDKNRKFIKAAKEVRDYQKDIFIHAVQKNRCLLLSPTLSGKSLIVYLLTRFIQLRIKNKILIIVPTTSL